MSMHLIRNTVTLLFILTLANLAASFAALHAVRSVREDAQAHMQRVDVALVQLTAITTRLCAEHGNTCSTMTVSAPVPHP